MFNLACSLVMVQIQFSLIKNKDWTSRTLANPQPRRPITSSQSGCHMCITPKDISHLFETTNHQLEKINQWFISNKLSLNVNKSTGFFINQGKGKIFRSLYQN